MNVRFIGVPLSVRAALEDGYVMLRGDPPFADFFDHDQLEFGLQGAIGACCIPEGKRL